MELFRIKPLEKILAEAEESGEHSLRKTLSATALNTNLMTFGFGYRF